jgi:hypothetical protein
VCIDGQPQVLALDTRILQQYQLDFLGSALRSVPLAMLLLLRTIYRPAPTSLHIGGLHRLVLALNTPFLQYTLLASQLELNLVLLVMQ